MSKDPAFLFYAQDFLVGTTFMTDEEVGIYIRLLCYQHQHGGLIDKDDFNFKVNGKQRIIKKFIETEDGFYNPRMMSEMVDRQRKCSNLSANAKKRWENDSKSNANAKHLDMPSEDEDENEDEDEDNIKVSGKNNRFRKPTISEVAKYCIERNNNIDPESFIDFYEGKGWMIGKNRMKDWKACVRTWEKRDIKKNNSDKKFNGNKIEKMIEVRLGKIATESMVKEVMREIPEKQWFLVDKFLRKRYKESDSSVFQRCECDLIRERHV